MVAAVEIPGYVLGAPLGAGAFGQVYRAHHTRMGREVAIKILHPRYSANPVAVGRFLAEARTVAGISHPNIVEVYDFGALADGRQFCVMELLEGTTLRDLMRGRGRIPLDEALPLLHAIAAAIDAAHAAGVAHRDLKPENVFVSARGKIKLIDFGLAKLSGDAAAPVTETGTFLGTPLYMSPEQCRGRAELGTDLYSFGAMTFHLLTGEPPFKGSAIELALQHLDAVPPVASRVLPAIPARVDRVLAALLDKDPARRPSPLSAVVATLADAPRPGRARGWLLLVGVVMAVMAAILLLAR